MQQGRNEKDSGKRLIAVLLEDFRLEIRFYLSPKPRTVWRPFVPNFRTKPRGAVKVSVKSNLVGDGTQRARGLLAR